MKRKFKVLIFILIIVIILIIGILIGKSINNNSKRQSELNYETQKIAVSSFIVVLNDEEETNIASSDIKIDSRWLNTFNKIINTSTIKEEIKKTYPNVKDIELKLMDNTEVIQAIYVCENYTEEECIDINNKYVSEFSKHIVEIYNISNIYVLDKANISERIVKK